MGSSDLPRQGQVLDPKKKEQNIPKYLRGLKDKDQDKLTITSPLSLEKNSILNGMSTALNF